MKENEFSMNQIFNSPNSFNMGIDPINEEPSKACITIKKGGKHYHYTQNKNESFKEFSQRVDKELRIL